MAATLISRLNVAIQRFEFAIASIFSRRYPTEELCLVSVEAPARSPSSSFSIKDIIGDGFFWAVPKHRRTIEKRLKRKFGNLEYGLQSTKLLIPRTTIRTCNTCGDDHLIGTLCPTCYKKVIDETKEMQEAIQNELKLDPVENEVVVLYKGEKDEKPDEFWEGKRIVELEKPRPQWFSKNLLQQTTQQPATTSDVKPSDLG